MTLSFLSLLMKSGNVCFKRLTGQRLLNIAGERGRAKPWHVTISVASARSKQCGTRCFHRLIAKTLSWELRISALSQLACKVEQSACLLYLRTKTIAGTLLGTGF